jgi:Na+:H+ antiporter, NhaC family
VEFERRGLPAFALSRAVGDSGSVTSPLIPWNSCGAYMAASLGVPTLAYAGFAFFCLFNPLATILIACFGFRVHRAALTSVDAPPQLVSDAAAPTPDKIVIKE